MRAFASATLTATVIAVASLAFFTASTRAADVAWPETFVKIEEMKLLTPLRIGVPSPRARGKVRGPAVLKVHVNTAGRVERVALHESCGSPAHDEATLHAMRDAQFAPKVIDGQARDVTLVLPLHLPKSKSSFDD